MSRTFSIIKPDATKRNLTGSINKKIEESKLKIIAQKRIKLSKDQAQGFYAVHKEKPFFNDLIHFMTSGPSMVLALQKENAIKSWRETIGATNPEEAKEGTIRKDFANNVQENAVHGSDSDENAEIEISFHFDNKEIFN